MMINVARHIDKRTNVHSTVVLQYVDLQYNNTDVLTYGRAYYEYCTCTVHYLYNTSSTAYL